MTRYIEVLIQIVDFLFKAAAHFAATADGQKEWQDIEIAYEMAVNHDDNPDVEYAVTETSDLTPAQVSAQAAKKANTGKARHFDDFGREV